jgi:hypothetical protein
VRRGGGRVPVTPIFHLVVKSITILEFYHDMNYVEKQKVTTGYQFNTFRPVAI